MAIGGSAGSADASQHKSHSSIYVAFIPWVLFSVITRRYEYEAAAIIALVAAVAISLPSLRVGRPKLLELGAIIAFVGFTIVGIDASAATTDWLARYARAISAGVLALIAFGSLATTPFTEQYARESVPRQFWSSPEFKAINRRITTIWGVVFLLMIPSHILAGAIDTHRAETIFNWVVPILLVGFAVKQTARIADAT
ncbi:MAG TPA: hypothetical protein VMB05_09955 [Solirubrobacteraceae bacterium]|nr:hypothetical protein [Solirubrobacteraceae bacterium]